MRQDPTYHRLTPQQRSFYIRKALLVGGEVAKKFEFSAGVRVVAVAERSGCRVRRVDDGNVPSGILLRADYKPREAEIVVYRRSVEQMRPVLTNLVLSEDWTLERVEDIHVAHELFHHVEVTDIGPVNLRLPKVVTFRFGPIIRRVSVRRTREIAAHKFTKDLLALPFLPNVADWIRV